MFSFSRNKQALEKEGIFVGGWDPRGVLWPRKVDGKHDSSEDRIQNQTRGALEWTEQEERALVRKLDLRCLFPCCIIYFLAYVDRGNLGNVKILGAGTPNSLQHSLGLKGTEFNWAVSITYFAVTAGLLPSNIAMKKYSAKLFLPVIMILWGAVVLAIAGVTNATGLLVARFCLGIPEAAVVPSCIMYFSMWYKPNERAFRIAIFHAWNCVASAVSSFLASGIGHMEGIGGLHAWQWVFLIEGALPIICAVPCYFALLTFPETSTALDERERFIAINRIGRGAARKTDQTFSWAAVWRVFGRPSTFVFFIAQTCSCTIAVAQATFLPTILKVFLKYSVTRSNIYAALTYIFMIPIYPLIGWHSDWTRDRMWHFVFSYTAWPSSVGGMCRPAQPVLYSYRSSTLYGAGEQAVGGAATVASLSIASIMGPQMYPDSDAPYFVPAFTATVCVISLGICAYLSLPLWLMWEANRRKAKTGFAIPLQAMEDEEHSAVSATAHDHLRDVTYADPVFSEKRGEFGGGDASLHEYHAGPKAPKVRKKRKTLSTNADGSGSDRPRFELQAISQDQSTLEANHLSHPSQYFGATNAGTETVSAISPAHVVSPTVKDNAAIDHSSTYIGRAHYDTTTPIDEDSARAYGASRQDAQSLAEQQTLAAWQAFALPPRAVHQSLIEAFIEYCHPWMPVLEISEKDQRQTPPSSFLLLQSIFTAASRVASSPSLSEYALPSDFYHRARALFWVGHESNPLTVIKAITMLHWYNPDGPAYVSYDTSEYWLKIGVGLAYQIGLHREPPVGVHRAMRRRVWWSLVVRDALISVSRGRPRAIQLSDCRVGRPDSEDFPESPTSGELFVSYVDICCALGDVVESFSRDSMTRDKRSATENVLFRWTRSLPQWLQLAQWSPATSCWEPKVHDFKARQLHVIYFVTLTILAKGTGTDRTISQVAILAASFIAGVYEDFLARDLVRTLSPTYTTFCFMAGLVLLPLRKDAALWERAQADLLVIQRSLEILAQRWKSAIGASKALQKAMESPSLATSRLAPLEPMPAGYRPLFDGYPLELCRMWMPCHEHASASIRSDDGGHVSHTATRHSAAAITHDEPDFSNNSTDYYAPFGDDLQSGFGDASFDQGGYFWSDWNLGV
ncbi:hypothetical protein LTS10_011806 [Elasticomyces elasticus]|nr:hypothetical protein LTS10_011806 [Elasticomyces elasticus]